MATLQTMPPIALLPAQLAALGVHWNTAANVLPKAQGEALGSLCDNAVGTAIATMLGGIPLLAPINKSRYCRLNQIVSKLDTAAS